MWDRCVDPLHLPHRSQKKHLASCAEAPVPSSVHGAVGTPDMKQTLTTLAAADRLFASRSLTLQTNGLVMEVPHHAKGRKLCKLLLPCLVYCLRCFRCHTRCIRQRQNSNSFRKQYHRCLCHPLGATGGQKLLSVSHQFQPSIEIVINQQVSEKIKSKASMAASREAHLNKAPYGGYAVGVRGFFSLSVGVRVLVKGQCVPVLTRSKKYKKKLKTPPNFLIFLFCHFCYDCKENLLGETSNLRNHPCTRAVAIVEQWAVG